MVALSIRERDVDLGTIEAQMIYKIGAKKKKDRDELEAELLPLKENYRVLRNLLVEILEEMPFDMSPSWVHRAKRALKI